MFPITSLYAGLLAVLLVGLSTKVIMGRRRARALIGDMGDKALFQAIRVHGNFTEYTPFALLLIALCEGQGAPTWSLHLLGSALVIGRVLHVLGFGRDPQIIVLRQIGMVSTFAVLVLAGVGLIIQALV
ncbi:MAPEG family protein [Rhodobacteraceae bacterium M382]|nr:MAPEG family protein [Rhodobacteraceae bacterium M382]